MTECINPPALTDEMLWDLLDHLADSDEMRHLARCPSCATRFAEIRKFEHALSERLERFECPPAQQLADYHMKVLTMELADQTGRHVAQCPRCQTELTSLMLFLSDPSEPFAFQPERSAATRPSRNVWRAARIDTGSLSMARGLEDEMSYAARANSATVFLEAKPQMSGIVLNGQVVDSVIDWTWALAEAIQSNADSLLCVHDETCEFRFEIPHKSLLELRITAASGVVLLLENLNLTY